jgi:hypothetical protein
MSAVLPLYISLQITDAKSLLRAIVVKVLLKINRAVCVYLVVKEAYDGLYVFSGMMCRWLLLLTCNEERNTFAKINYSNQLNYSII